MPRKHATLVAAAQRVVEARRIVADQEALIANLRAAKRPTADAEAALYIYLGRSGTWRIVSAKSKRD
jgi:hypothetical protein